MLRLLLALALALSPPGITLAEGGLQEKLEALTATMPATVGIAVVIDGRETVTVNNDQRFPLMSVFKIHQALDVADRLGARLARPLAGTGAILGHKTGTSDRDEDGRLMALNDMGFVLLRDGRHYVIAVFIKDSRASDAETEAMIADISACVYRHFARSASTPP